MDDLALDISFNKIEKSKITYLNLFQSNLNDSTLSSILNSLESSSSLKVLSVSFNNLMSFDLIKTITNFKQLVYLDLSNNQISTINFNEEYYNKSKQFSSMLETLDISFNCLKNFKEILNLIYFAHKEKIQNLNNDNKITDTIFMHFNYISFFGNPIPHKIWDYLFRQENINLLNLYLNIEKNKEESNKCNKHSENNNYTDIDFEIFYRDIDKILESIQLSSINNNNKLLEEDEKSVSMIKQNICKTEEKENISLKQIKNLDLNFDFNDQINVTTQNFENDLKYQNKLLKTEGIYNDNYINIEKLKKSDKVVNIVNYNLIDDLKQFNVIYHTYSFKKCMPENNKNVIKEISKYDLYNGHHDYEINEENFNCIFQEKVDKDKSSNVLLLSKQKISSIPIICRSEENENQVDLIFLNPSSDNLKIKYDSETEKSIKIIFLNINKLKSLVYLDQFSELEELYLQNNKLKLLPNFCMKKLKKLDISNNNLLSLKGISNLKQLVNFNCENNSINSLNLSELLELEELLEFNISGNNIYNLKECISLKNMKKIFNLDLTGNEVCNTNDFRITLINYLPRIKILNRIPIDKNELVSAKEFFEGRITNELLESKIGCENTINIKELDLSNNKLKDFDNIFNSNNFLNLKKLNLSRNIFSNFKIFGYLPNLVELYLNSNLFERMLGKKDKPLPNRGILGLPVSFIIFFIKFTNRI